MFVENGALISQVLDASAGRAPDMTHALYSLGNGDMGAGIVTLWKAGQKAGEMFIDPHVPDMVIRPGGFIKSFPQGLKFLNIFRMKTGLSASLDILLVDFGHRGSIEMHPF